jgi:hypothetical protein
MNAVFDNNVGHLMGEIYWFILREFSIFTSFHAIFIAIYIKNADL